MKRLCVAAGAVVLATVAVVVGPAGTADAASLRPVITSMSAHDGALAGGTTITVHGKQLRSTYHAALATGVARFRVVSDSTVRVRIPRSRETRRTNVYLYTSHGRSLATVHSQWDYWSRPTVGDLSVTTGALAGGKAITVRGTDLRSVQKVTFGTTTARIVSRHGTTSLAVVVPKHVAGAVDVTVRTPYGTSAHDAVDRFTYVAAPTVTHVESAVSPPGGGATVIVDGTHFTAASRVTLGGTPAKAVAVTASTEMMVTTPARAAGPADVVVTTAYGTSSKSVSDQVYYQTTQPATEWTSGQVNRQGAGYSTVVSCPATTFCLATDGGSAEVFDGAHWVPIASPVLSGVALGIDCSSPVFCMVVGAHGSATYDGASWTSSAAPASGLRAVSCPADGQCVAIGYGGTAVFDHGTWAGSASVPATAWHLSCRSLISCVAVERDTAYRFSGIDGAGWIGTTIAGAGDRPVDLADVSCPTDSFCAAADRSGYEWTLHAGSWVRGPLLDTRSNPATIDCADGTSCVLGAYDSQAMAVGGAATTASVDFEKPLSGSLDAPDVSCASATFCVAFSTYGQASVYDGTAWSAPDSVVLPQGDLASVSCVSRTWCLATDEMSNVYRFDGSGWVAPTRVDPYGLTSQQVSCASVTLCATLGFSAVPAVEPGGDAAVFDGTTWHPFEAVLPDPVAISCEGTRCLAVSAAQYVVYDADSGSWSQPKAIGLRGVVGVSCASPTDCEAIGGTSTVRFTGSSWAAPQVLRATTTSHTDTVDAVSCSGSTCLVAAGGGYATTRNAAGIWGTAHQVADGMEQISCATGKGCLATLSFGGDLTGRVRVQKLAGGAWGVPYFASSQTVLGRWAAGLSCGADGFCMSVQTDGATVSGQL